MYRYLIAALLLCMAISPLNAQNAAADFNGSSGAITIPNIGDAVNGASGLTIMGWVNARNASPSFPDFDGFFGFRNDVTFDFYVLQLSPTNIEVRFRNSTTTAYNIISTGLVLNTWQHFAMVYDGTTLSFYINGVLDGSVAASGSIASFGEEFEIGNLYWAPGLVHYYTDGQVDNVQVWKRALSDTEIVDLHCREIIDGAMYPDLVSHYVLNDTTGATSTPDAIGSYNGNISGGVTFGASGVTACDAFSVFTSASICDGDSVPFAGGYLTTTGIYVDTLTSSGGLDSIVTLDLMVYPPLADPVLTQPNDSTLQSTPGDTYMWYLDGTLLPGETEQNLYNPIPGVYTVVVVDSNGCMSGVSNDLIITLPPSNGLAELLESGLQYQVQGDYLTIQSDFPMLQLQIFSMDGRLQTSRALVPGNWRIPLPAGVSVVHFRTAELAGALKVLN